MFSMELAALQPLDDKITQFSDYLVDTYISEDSIFPPHIWAEKSSSIHRTTNACESFHSKFNSYFESPHPNIFKFIDILKLIQTETVILMQSSHKPKLHGRLQIRNKIIFIDTQIKKLNEKKISNFEYLQILAKKYKPKQCYK